MTESYLILGKVVGTHGLHGALKVTADRGILSTLPSDLTIKFSPENTAREFNIVSTSKQKTFIIKLQEITTIEKAESFVGKNLYIERSKVPPALEGEYYEFQLIGLVPREKDKVYSEFTLVNIVDSPAHPLLEFSDGSTNILIPYISRFIGAVDLEKKEIEVIDWVDWFHAL